MAKHFNTGNVWGRVTRAKEGVTRKKRTPYLEIEIDCASRE